MFHVEHLCEVPHLFGAICEKKRGRSPTKSVSEPSLDRRLAHCGARPGWSAVSTGICSQEPPDNIATSALLLLREGPLAQTPGAKPINEAAADGDGGGDGDAGQCVPAVQEHKDESCHGYDGRQRIERHAKGPL